MNKMELNDLFDYPNLKIYQYKKYFKFSLDSILLAEFVKINKITQNILDLCTGNAAVPLILSTKTKAHIDGFEIQKEIFELAKESILYNKLDKQITVYNEDIKNIDEFKKNQKYDIITCNPPFFKVNNNKSFINDFSPLALARHEISITLEDVFKIAKSHLNTKGELYLVHRLERLDEIIILGDKYKLNVKNIELIKTKEDNKPSIVLVRCVKDASRGIKINNIKNINEYTSYQNMFKEE